MKKILSLILVCVMLLGLCACGSSDGGATTEPQNDNTILAGFGTGDITPTQLGVPMGGYGNDATRLSTGLGSYIYALAVAVTDSEGNTAIMMSVDQCSMGAGQCQEIRSWARQTYNIPEENIIISSIHQHSTPISTAGNYKNDLTKGMKKAITDALDDRAPAEVYGNKVETQAMNFVRRAWYKDGGFVTSHSGDRSSGFDHYETEADPEMRLLKFVREGKDPIIMVNFQCHPHMGTSSSMTDIHADWPGIMRETVTEELGAKCVYFSGGGANMNSSSYEKSHMISTDYKHHGQRAANYVIDAEDSYTRLNVGKVLCKEVTNDYATDHSLDHLFDSAQVVAAARSSGGMDAAKEAIKNYPELNSVFQASAVVDKHGLGDTKSCTLSVITFGDIAFSAHPYEMFDTNAKELRDGTVGNENYDAEDQLANPFAMTFVASLGNGSNGYIPARHAYANGGYEPDTTRYAIGAGEQMVGDSLHMLNELYAG